MGGTDLSWLTWRTKAAINIDRLAKETTNWSQTDISTKNKHKDEARFVCIATKKQMEEKR